MAASMKIIAVVPAVAMLMNENVIVIVGQFPGIHISHAMIGVVIRVTQEASHYSHAMIRVVIGVSE